MSYSYAYNPIVSNPRMSKHIPQMESGGFQTPFFFGGSQVPTDLFIPKNRYNGSSGSGFHKGSPSITHPTDLDFTFKKGSKSKTHLGDLDFTAKKGTHSKTHLGDLDFTTKKGDMVFHRKGHNIKIPHTLPFEK
jgi:hypothetical protein